ncbi:hypothetical protein JB92DRAFT_2825196 [Gautieria morchelliformis]|nr:hypothetical protein JB92DRAFT_2825196 [Gautieria morchelliformis]
MLFSSLVGLTSPVLPRRLAVHIFEGCVQLLRFLLRRPHPPPPPCLTSLVLPGQLAAYISKVSFTALPFILPAHTGTLWFCSVSQSIIYTSVMGKRSKAKSGRLRKLQGARTQVQEPTEDDTDTHSYSTEDGEERNEELTSDFEWHSDSEEGEDDDDDDDEFEAEVRSEAALLVFARTLADAQNMALEVERRKEMKCKWAKCYTGNALRTKQRWAEK